MDGGMLAAGGITAFAVGLWSQVKQTFGYLSGFLIISAHMKGQIARPVSHYLKATWQPLPSGTAFYMGSWYQFRDRSEHMLVPFRLRGNHVIYRSGWRFVLRTGAGEMKLWSVRGLVDFDALISEALDWSHARRISGQDPSAAQESTRFTVRTQIGFEKLPGARFAQGDTLQSNHPGKPPHDTAPESFSVDDFDVGLDLSFKYRLEDYLWSSKADPFDGLYFSPYILSYVRQAERWLSMGDWYRERGIPWRRGWLLAGPPGTGKSSLAKAVARTLDVPIYHYYLATLSDQEFIERWEDMETPCIALFEDFDTIFHKREPLTPHKSLTFQCVLNEISGVSSHGGVFLMITTNDIEAIDEAIGVAVKGSGISTRPGRIDTVIQIGTMTQENRLSMARKILRDWPWIIDDAVAKGAGMTPGQFQELCIQSAFGMLDGPGDECLVCDAGSEATL